MSEDYLVEIKNLKYQRANKLIFSDISLNVQRNKITAVMGPSGTGKTTLLKLIGAQLRPNKGSVIFDGQDVHRLSRKKLFSLRSRMGLLFQAGALFSDLNVFENVAFPLRIHTNLPLDMIRDLVLFKLECVGLRGAAELMPSQLSGGMARRIALARAVALDPELVMYDEPFAGQDPISMGVLLNLIKNLNKNFNNTTVVVSHDVSETLEIADYVYIIANHKVIDEGSAKAIRSSANPWVQQFLRGAYDGPVPLHYPANDIKQHLQING